MKYTRYALTLVLFFITMASVKAQQQEDIGYLSSGARLHPLLENMDIRHYDIRLAVDIANRSIAGTVVVDILTAKTTDSLLLDLIHFYTVTAVKVDGKTVGFTHLKDRIFISAQIGRAHV